MRRGNPPALLIHAQKAREYLAEHKTVSPRKLARVLMVSTDTAAKAINLLRQTVKVHTVRAGKNGKGGGWELAGETVREL